MCTAFCAIKGFKLFSQQMATGEVEVSVDRLEILNECRRTLPFEIHSPQQVS